MKLWNLEGNACSNALSLGIHLLYQNINIPPNKITGILWFSFELKVILVKWYWKSHSESVWDRFIATLPHWLLSILKLSKEYSRSHKGEELCSPFCGACPRSVARCYMLRSPAVCYCSSSLSSVLNRGEARRRWGSGKVWAWGAVPREQKEGRVCENNRKAGRGRTRGLSSPYS